ncbi:hypothetical protein A2Z23_00045 [Candidatus Curtissbacteria bacterium RBG_16_39_7]|uniref:Uncharacterized protein n=1 Tax=Candidatus Curtissbacteria bacterium RBG_16_39_7 TaxID=1797707 RepID=A0A1F5G3R7_9BACT|nr:MAG: hypothetical protein A2Z23_00045 [Candidatus Curtissbacteria bacterium RBG_16_39_7]
MSHEWFSEELSCAVGVYNAELNVRDSIARVKGNKEIAGSLKRKILRELKERKKLLKRDRRQIISGLPLGEQLIFDNVAAEIRKGGQ